jgi:hypothetical protein
MPDSPTVLKNYACQNWLITPANPFVLPETPLDQKWLLVLTGVAQFGQETVGAVAADDVVADGDSNDCGSGDVAGVVGNDADHPLVHDRQHAFHLVQHVFGLGIIQRTQRVRTLEFDDEPQCGIEASPLTSKLPNAALRLPSRALSSAGPGRSVERLCADD